MQHWIGRGGFAHRPKQTPFNGRRWAWGCTIDWRLRQSLDEN